MDDRLEKIINLLIDNGDLDCKSCGHRARDIEWLVRIAEAAQKLVDNTISDRVSGRIDLWDLRKALDRNDFGTD